MIGKRQARRGLLLLVTSTLAYELIHHHLLPRTAGWWPASETASAIPPLPPTPPLRDPAPRQDISTAAPPHPASESAAAHYAASKSPAAHAAPPSPLHATSPPRSAPAPAPKPVVGAQAAPPRVPAEGNAQSGAQVFDMWEVYPKMSMENHYNPGPNGVGSWTQGWDIQYDASTFETGEKLEIYVVPHSHNDPGWKETFEEWYSQKTGAVLDTMVSDCISASRDHAASTVGADVSVRGCRRPLCSFCGAVAGGGAGSSLAFSVVRGCLPAAVVAEKVSGRAGPVQAAGGLRPDRAGRWRDRHERRGLDHALRDRRKFERGSALDRGQHRCFRGYILAKRSVWTLLHHGVPVQSHGLSRHVDTARALSN